MEKRKARFLIQVTPNSSYDLNSQGMYFKYVSFDEATEADLRKKADEWLIKSYSSYTYENDDYGTSDSGSSVSDTPLTKMTSISSGCYSTDEVRGDILLFGNQIGGAVILVKDEGGSGWSNYRKEEYSILYIDGATVGSTTQSYSFSGESSSRYSECSYRLIKAD